MQGVYIPVITPFLDGEVDYQSYRTLIKHFIETGIHGIMPMATTGEAPAIEADEYYGVIDATLEEAAGRVPVIPGICGNATNKMVRQVEKLNGYPVGGYLVTAPYYNLPSQEGIYRHFKTIADSTDKQIYIYNIPYRTGRNMENETILRLAEISNISGIKDSCGNPGQSIELITKAADDFSVMTGEDIFYLANLCHGGAGGVMASAHIDTVKFLKIFEAIRSNDLLSATALWKQVSVNIPLFFNEPNPAPIKYLLYKKGLIRSPEVRGPLWGISESLKARLDKLV